MTIENYYQEKLRCQRFLSLADGLLAVAIRDLDQAVRILNVAVEEIHCHALEIHQSTHKGKEASWKITSSIIRKQKSLI